MDSKRRSYSASGIVLARGGCPEERQQPVAGQLRDRAAETFDLHAHEPHDLVEEEL